MHIAIGQFPDFATRIEAIEALKDSHRSALNALQQRAFAGHL